MGSTAREDVAYEIYWSTAHLGDDATDASLVKFSGWELSLGLTRPYALELPARVCFQANLRAVASSDYPVNDANWPLMSPRMRSALRGVGLFAHREITVTLLDDRISPEARLGPDGTPRPFVANVDFAAVQLTELTDAFDWERSTYVRHPTLAGRVKTISKLVLRVPSSGLPPLFRLSARSSQLFASAAARRALDDAGVRGVDYWPLSRTAT